MLTAFDPTMLTAAFVSVLTAGGLAIKLYFDSRSAAREREAAAKEREASAAERLVASQERKAALDATRTAVVLTEATSKKADALIESTSKIHELTNSTNSNLQKTLEVSTEKIAGLEKLIAQMQQTRVDTAAARQLTDHQTQTALAAPSPAQIAGVQAAFAEHDAWERAQRTQEAARPHTSRAGDATAHNDAVVTSLEAIDAHTKGIEENTARARPPSPKDP